MRNSWRWLVALTLLMSGYIANAAGTPQDCSNIDDSIERLNCYDGFFQTTTRANASSSVESPAATSESLVLARQGEEALSAGQWFSITPHRPNYIIPVTYNTSSDFSTYGAFGDFFSDAEAKFQLSLKTKIWPTMWRDSSLSVAYTQQSYWQLYADSDASAPFRATDHEPELIWELPVDFRFLGFDARLASFSFNHQSNGGTRPLSRSWNRLTGQIVMERGGLVLSAQSWVRIDDPEFDDNPNIEDYMGRIQLGAGYKLGDHTLALGIKNNLRSDNRSGVEFNWTFPLAQHLKGYVQLYSGYGENLIDMENYNNRIGVGIALTDWL